MTPPERVNGDERARANLPQMQIAPNFAQTTRTFRENDAREVAIQIAPAHTDANGSPTAAC